MSTKCRYCGSKDVAVQDSYITGGLCVSCAQGVLSKRDNARRFINSFIEPILFLQDDPRLVVMANQNASFALGKKLAHIQGKKGGQVFGCAHSYSEPGCGLDPNCRDCAIKKAIVDTLVEKKPSTKIYSLLNVLGPDQIVPYHLEIRTEPIGDFALVRIDRYAPAE